MLPFALCPNTILNHKGTIISFPPNFSWNEMEREKKARVMAWMCWMVG